MEPSNCVLERDKDLIDKIFSLPETDHWTKTENNAYNLVTLEPDSAEFQRVKAPFNCTFKTIEKIVRVENPFLLGQYLLKKRKIMMYQGSVSEHKLFHATRASNVNSICENNFNWRLRGRSRGHKFGQGVSFSPDAYYSSHYGSVFFVVNVLVRKACVGGKSTVLPPSGYDTTTNGKETVYVKYEDDEFYPGYIIYCQ